MRPKLLRQHLRDLQAQLAIRLPALPDATDPEALHEARVLLRRLRALLRPVSKRAAIQPLYALAGQVLAASGPLRDLDVLAADLAAHRRGGIARQRLVARGELMAALLGSPAFPELQARVAARAPLLRAAALPVRRKLEDRVAERLTRDRDTLRARLADPDADLHRIRLDIKHLRYQLEAQAAPGAAARRLRARLARAQGVLGDWHDRELWMDRAGREADLASCRARWAREHAALGEAIVPLLAELRHDLKVTLTPMEADKARAARRGGRAGEPAPGTRKKAARA